jgi:hypothetical protein
MAFQRDVAREARFRWALKREKPHAGCLGRAPGSDKKPSFGLTKGWGSQCGEGRS